MSGSFIFVCFLLPSLIYCANAPFGVYSMTLGVPNMLSIFAGASDGTITYVKQIDTGGNGSFVGEAGIQSQSSITVLGNYLFAVNPGSATLSMFAINPQDPTNVTLVGTPASTGGDWPNSVTAWGTYVCVVNTGANNGLQCYTFSSTGLTVIAGSNRQFGLILNTPPISHMGPAEIAFTPSGSALIVSVKGMNPPVLMYTFASGTVGESSIQSASNGMVNFGFTFDTDGTVVLVDAAPYGNGSGVILLTVGSDTITFNTANYFLIPGEAAACWITRSNATSHFYIANAASNAITELSRSGNTLTVVAEYPLGNSTTPTDVTVVSMGSQDYLFTNEAGAMMINAMKLVPGAATMIGTISSHQGSTGVGLASFVASTPTTTGSTTNAAAIHTILPILSLLLIVLLL